MSAVDTDYGVLFENVRTADGEGVQERRMHRRELAENLARTITIYKHRQQTAKGQGKMPPNWLDSTLRSLERQHLELIRELEDEEGGHDHPDNCDGHDAASPWIPWAILACVAAVICAYLYYFRS